MHLILFARQQLGNDAWAEGANSETLIAAFEKTLILRQLVTVQDRADRSFEAQNHRPDPSRAREVSAPDHGAVTMAKH